MDGYGKMMDVAVTAAKEAGLYALGRVGSVIEVSHKEGRNNLVTDVDKKSEEMIVGRIRKAFPDHSVLAEEGGEKKGPGECTWVIDPLDGTTNYAHAFPFFCVSIGVMSGGDMKAGVVYDPSRDELFRAEKGKGAYLNSKRIKVSDAANIEDSLIATGFAYDPALKMENIKYMGKVLESAQAVRRAGSAALDLCYVACGRFDGFWEQGLKPWDISAGQLIVTEAGGTVTMMEGQDLDIYKGDVVATNGNIHANLLSILNA